MIELLTMPKEQLESCFLEYKRALYSYIEASFSWDENDQKKRFQTRYDPSWFYRIISGSTEIGFVCFFETDKALHISLLIMYQNFRGKGYGKSVMDMIHERAEQNSVQVTLSSFKKNTAAIRFYHKLGYVIEGEDDVFVDLVRKCS